MRIALAGFMHESATFSHVPTELDDFHILQGDALAKDAAQGRSELAGAKRALSGPDIEIVPTLSAGATPSGLVAEHAFRTLQGQLMERVTQAPLLDGMVLALHGSTTVKGVVDAQGELAEDLRNALGPNVPIVATLDLHATPSDRVIENIDALVAYRTAPHRDIYETGVRAGQMLLRILRTGERPALLIGRLPLLLPGELGQTDIEPMAALMRMARDAETACPEIWSVSILQGYPWADLPDPGVSVLLTTDADIHVKSRVTRLAATLQNRLWASREALHRSVTVIPVDEALSLARTRVAQGLVTYLCDSGDNPTAGADADDARLLPILEASGLAHVTFAAVADPVAVERCLSAGTGGRIRLTVGGGPSGRPEVTVPVEGIVHSLAQDPEGGRIARVTTGCVELLLSERRMGLRGPDVLASVGIDPKAPGSVHVLKSGYLFPAFADLIAQTEGALAVLMATPGASSLDLGQMPFRNVRRPVFPLDPDTTFTGSVGYRPSLPARN